MKDKIFTVIWGLVFFFVFLLGALFGPCLRPLPYLRLLDRKDLRLSDDCTCVICLPDKFCHKCGHKSRDCPKLSWYFRRVPKQ